MAKPPKFKTEKLSFTRSRTLIYAQICSKKY